MPTIPPAELIWDGDTVRIPSSMETPAPNQMQGTPAEQLSEVSGRTCYDSMGIDPETGKTKGRSSAQFHHHILEVTHLSVHEHFNFTVEVPEYNDFHIYSLVNRPGIWLEQTGRNLEITANIRAIMEWERYNNPLNMRFPDINRHMHSKLLEFGNALAPQVVPESDYRPITSVDDRYKWRIVPTDRLREHQAWIALYMTGTRGWSHEQVRHGNETGISQRSTRYVDESDSPYLLHPLLQQYLRESPNAEHITSVLADVENVTKAAYVELVNGLQEFITKKGITDKTTARKQARGASRNMLCMALQTEMVFSASVAQWQWMLNQRCSNPADAEIRVIYNAVLPALQASQYSKYFQQYQLVPAADGLGQVLA